MYCMFHVLYVPCSNSFSLKVPKVPKLLKLLKVPKLPLQD